MPLWYTGKPNEYTQKSHINRCVLDSAWKTSTAFKLDHDKNVVAWVKNDHLGFEIPYIFNGVVHKYRPDFLIKMENGNFLILEVKGQEKDPGQVKERGTG